MSFKAIMFDCDGTLINTLPDITNALNCALKDFHIDHQYSVSDTRQFVGGGALLLVSRALKQFNKSEEEIKKFAAIYHDYYLAKQCETSEPFPGMVELINHLHELDIKTFVVTNKPQEMSDVIIADKFPKNSFIEVIGESKRFALKPNPEMINYLVEKYHLNKDEILYVGDMQYDMEFAHNAGIRCALMTYGYGKYDTNLLKLATYVAKDVSELKSIIEKTK